MISFRTFSIVTIGALLVLSGALMYKPALFITPTVKEAQTASPIDQSHCRHDDNCYNYNGNYDISPITIKPLINTINYGGSSTLYANTQPGNGISGISSQLLANQQNTANQIQTCINNARQMANQLNALKNQEVQVQQQIDALNNQLSRIDTSTNGGQQRQDALNAQIQQLQNRIDQIDNVGSQGEDTYRNRIDNCKQTVSQLEQHREDLESQLDDNFGNTIDAIQIP